MPLNNLPMEKSLHRNYFPLLQRSEQYLTFSQSRAHFLRHSKSNPQRTHVFGAKPFLVLAFIYRAPESWLQSQPALSFDVLQPSYIPNAPTAPLR